MANRSVSAVLGHCTTLLALVDENAAELSAAGLDVTKFRGPLVTHRDSLAHSNNEQEELKGRLVAKTAEVEQGSDATYLAASSLIDAIRGVAGKTSALAKQATALRTELNKTRTRSPKPSGELPKAG